MPKPEKTAGTMPEIRDATLDDSAFIADANARLALETEDKQLDPATLKTGVEAALTDRAKARYWIAEVDGQAVGQIMVTMEWSDWRNGFFWWIQSVYVHASHREQGIFRQLYDHVAGQARDANDVCGLRLYVEADNQRAQAVYEKLGMSPTSYQLFELEF